MEERRREGKAEQTEEAYGTRYNQRKARFREASAVGKSVAALEISFLSHHHQPHVCYREPRCGSDGPT